MKERIAVNEQEDPYWNTDEQIGRVQLWNREFMLRLRGHVSTETYAGSHEDLIPLQPGRSERGYALANPSAQPRGG